MNDFIVLRNVFREVFDNDSLNITENTLRNEIEEWDSVEHIKLILTVENEFGIRLSTDEVSAIKSVGDFLTVIKRRKGA